MKRAGLFALLLALPVFAYANGWNSDIGDLCKGDEGAFVTVGGYVLPCSDGEDGQVLATDGSGIVSWATGGGGGNVTGSVVKVDGTALSTANFVDSSDINATASGSSVTMALTTTASNNIAKGVTAYGWGNHSAAGYLADAPIDGTQYARKDGNWTTVSVVSVETDPIYTNSTAHSISAENITRWDSSLKNETDTLQSIVARGNSTNLKVFLNGSLSTVNAEATGSLSVSGTSNLKATNVVGAFSATGATNTTEYYSFGNSFSGVRSAVTAEPAKLDILNVNAKALINGVGAISGMGDYFYLVDKKSNYAITTSGPTIVQPLANVFDNNVSTNMSFPVANLATVPLIITIEKTDATVISSTDVAQLIIIPHRLFDTNTYACFTDWKIEAKLGSTYATSAWTDVLNRTGVSDRGIRAIPLYVATSGYTSVYGVRITISGAYSTDGVTTSGSCWIAGIKYLDSRPAFGAAEALGAVDQAGGTIYGAINLATYSGNVGVGTTATTAKLTTVGNGAFDSVVIGDVTNSTNSTYSRTVYGTGRRYTVGVGGANETDLGVANKFYVYDANASAIRTVIDANGNVGVGTTAPSATLSVIGTVSINGTYGYTGSGSNCTITSITSGIITGASCV